MFLHVSCPGTIVDSLVHRYTHDLLDKHTPQITRNFHKEKAKWLSESFQEAKTVKRQLERIWRKNKTVQNRSRLRQQISRCNALVNSDKASYYKELVRENSQDSKKLWKALKSALHNTADSVLPAHSSKKNLADSFVNFFSDKIAKIRDCFSSTDQFDLSPVTPPTAIADFKQVSETEVHKIIMNSPTKSCLLDPWPTFLLKECLNILLPSITKLVNCSLAEGVVPKKVLKMPL